MRKFTLLLSAFGLVALTAKSQTVATFESLPLAGTDTFYINLSAPGTDVGFNNGLAYFPCQYDTSFGSYYWSGFVYSNMTDTATSGYMNQFSAKTGAGYGGSSKYVVSYCGYPQFIPLTGAARRKTVKGFYVTNSTYAYNSMREGDGYGKKFGGATGNDPDWFKLTVRGNMTTDTVQIYLADFRPAGTANDSIIKGWHWVDLMPLGEVDSLQFTLSSSDTNSSGIKTPAYFCIDNFTTYESLAAPVTSIISAAKVYPVPGGDVLNIDFPNDNEGIINVLDVSGHVVMTQEITVSHNAINIAQLKAGNYILNITQGGLSANTRFIKR
ncbi:MAG: DUF4465 domain-containing protein [Taibaiella sp.]|nr:DUF4465 domain-containing protein [Taibaiella sp.]